MIPRKILDELAIEPEWTVEDDSGAGFVAGELGTWLALTGGPDRSYLRVEVRLARGVHSGDGIWSLYGKRLVLPRSLGRLVHDPHTMVLSLVADLPVAYGTAGTRLLSGCVVELVHDGETIAAQQDLPGFTAVTLVGGERRSALHPLVRRSPRIHGSRDDAVTALNLLRDAIAATSPPGWTVRHRKRATTVTGPNGESLLAAADYGRSTGWGLSLTAKPSLTARESPHQQGIHLADLNRTNRQRGLPAPGHWIAGDGGSEYRLVLPAHLLSLAAATPSWLEATVTAVAARCLDVASAEMVRPLLLCPRWAGDDDAVLLKPRRNVTRRARAVPAVVAERVEPQPPPPAVAEAEELRQMDLNRWTAARLLARLGDDPTLVTSVAVQGKLAVIPLRTALQGAKERAALAAARTYGEVRSAGWGPQVDDTSRDHLLDYYCGLHESRHPDEDLDDLTSDELWDRVLPDDDEPFTLDGHPAFDTSASDYADPPEADLDLDTDDWMPSEVADRFGEVEDGYYAMPSQEWEGPEFVYPAERRDEIEEALKDLGFTIVRDDALISSYQYAPPQP
ncbi:hypothetical protein [Microbispora sp. H11081]|uniref:hypothetical protein n=1 Tax=Microbispora sp. H11081 TaxID=2729107 RepID=UPI0014753360|nr:hypothetical protein [Microbispora sp. H11081]